MKVLLLTTEEYASVYSELYAGMHKKLGSMDMRRLNDDEQTILRSYFSHHVDLKKFDRIIIHLDFPILKPQLRFLKQLDDIVFYHTNAFFNNHRSEKANANALEQIAFFKKIPWAKIIVTNCRAMKLFQHSGLDAWFVPEGYNTIKYRHKGLTRKIELALVENVSPTKKEKEFKHQLHKYYPNLYTEQVITDSGATHLNQARIAICADIGRGEYSAKIFRAMASGCLVISYDQGSDESFYMSLQDMKNIVLFNEIETMRKKIDYLLQHPKRLAAIARAGYELAINNHKESELGRRAGSYIVTGMRHRDDYKLGISAFGFRV